MLSIECETNTINSSNPVAGRSDSQRSVSLSRLETSSKYQPVFAGTQDKSNAVSKHRRRSAEATNFSSGTNQHTSFSNSQQTIMAHNNTDAPPSSVRSLKLQQVPSSASSSTSIRKSNHNFFQPTSKSQKLHLQPDSSEANSANNNKNSYPRSVAGGEFGAHTNISTSTSSKTGIESHANCVGVAVGKIIQDKYSNFTASGDEIANSVLWNQSSSANVDRFGTSIVAQVKKRKNGADEEGDHSPLSLGSAVGTVDQQISGTLALITSQVAPTVDRVLRETVFDSLFISCKRYNNLSAANAEKNNFTFQSFDPFKSSPIPATSSPAVTTHASDSWEIQTFKNPNQFQRPSFLPMKDEVYDINEAADETLRSVSQQRAKLSITSNNNFCPITPVKTFPSSKVNTTMSLGSSEPALSSPRAQSSPPWINYLSSGPLESTESSDRNNGPSNLPPSPPLTRKHAVHAGSPTMLGSGNHEKYVELLTQYNTLKKQLVELENKVKFVQGQSMVENDVNKLPEYKNLMSQISKVRNQLKEWKSRDHPENFLWTSESMKENMRESGLNLAKLQHMKEVMLTATERLADKRREANRPYEISQMSEVDIKIEKEQTQKELLNFEKLFGRVKTKEERQIATALYDRYRALKKLSKSTNYSKSTPSTIDSDITDINSDFGDNNSTGRSPAVAVYLPGVTSEAISSGPPEESSGISLKDLEIERAMLLDRKRKLYKSVNSINRSIDSYKQQTDVDELKRVKARLKQIEIALNTMGSGGSSGK